MISKGTNTRTAYGQPRQFFVLLALVAAILLIALAQIGNASALAGDTQGDDDSYAFYTERYWQAAAERQNQLNAEAVNSDGDGYAFYTERYWHSAATRQAQSGAVDVADSAGDDDGYAYYTERYWRAAAERSQAAAHR